MISVDNGLKLVAGLIIFIAIVKLTFFFVRKKRNKIKNKGIYPLW
jgi:hypothetical protein